MTPFRDWRARRELLALARDHHESLRLAAVYGLSMHVPSPDVIATLSLLESEDPNPDVRLAASLVRHA